MTYITMTKRQTVKEHLAIKCISKIQAMVGSTQKFRITGEIQAKSIYLEVQSTEGMKKTIIFTTI